MEKNAIVILFLALTSTSSDANFFLGSGALFPFFLSSSIPSAFPFDFTQQNRIQAEGGSIYFQNPNEYYDRLQTTSEYVERKKNTPTVTQSIGYQIPSEQHQGSFSAQGVSQKRPTQYIENQGAGQIHNHDQLTQYKGTVAQNSPLQYSQDKRVQGPQISQNYNSAQNVGSSVSQNIPVQYLGTEQNFQPGIPTIRPFFTPNRFGQTAAGDINDEVISSDFQANTGSKGQISPQNQGQSQFGQNQDLPSQYTDAAAMNRPHQFQDNKQSQVLQTGQNYKPVQNVPLSQNLAGQYPGTAQSQPAQNFQQRIPTARPVTTQNRFGQNQASTGATQPLRDETTRDRVGPNNFKGNTASNVQIPVKQPGESSSTSVTGFGLEIMKVLDRAEVGNLVMSPYSVALILALLQQGSSGEAQTEITRALGMSPQMSREFFRQVDSTMKSRRSRNTLKMANAIFVSDSITIDPQYKAHATKYFGSNFVSTDFDNGQLAANKLNTWVSTSTQGLIPYLVTPDSVSADTQLLLANAIFFKGLWNETFSSQRTISKYFHLSDGSTKPASFMHISGSFQSGRHPNLDADFLVLPFEGFQYSLIVVVPSEKSSISSMMSQIEPQHIDNILRTPYRDAIVSLPKFKIRVDMDLSTPLIGMGIDDIFTMNSGLTALVTPGGARPRVTGALHTAVLSIDEKGGSAAAATLLAVSTLSLDSYEQEFMFKADRPFIAMLWDIELSVPLFIAKIADPTLDN